MLKNDVIATMSEKTGFTKSDSEKALTAFEDVVIEAMESGTDVTLTGFAKFFVDNVEERQGRDPRENKPITIPAHKAVKVKILKSLKESVR